MSDSPFTMMMLATIFPYIPQHLKGRVMLKILAECGFNLKQEDLNPTEVPPSKTMPVVCPYCLQFIGTVEESEPPERSQLLERHLDVCTPFQVILRKLGEHHH